MITFPELLARSDGPPIGTFMKIPAIEAVEVLKIAGFDFVVIDGEHAMLSMRDLDNMIVIARAIELPPIVRISDHGIGDVQRILDAGAAGIFVPHVSNGGQARQVVSQMVHPPLGIRGAGGGMRAADWGMTPEGRASYTDPNRVWRVAMIEEKEAVDDVDNILATPNLSAVFIGPGDLSYTMGLPGSDPAVQDAIETAFKKAKAAGIPVATVAPDIEGVKRLIDHGYDWILASNDISIFGKGARDFLAAVRGH